MTILYTSFLLLVGLVSLTSIARAEKAAPDQAQVSGATASSPKILVGHEDDYGAWDPYADFHRMQAMMNRFFKQSFQDPFRFVSGPDAALTGAMYIPEFDFRQTDSDFVIEMDLPGMEKSDIGIDVEGNVLKVSGEREQNMESEDTIDNGQYFYQGRSFGSFQRSVKIPENSKPEKISAKYDQGVLTITIPKKEVGKEKQSIKVPIE